MVARRESKVPSVFEEFFMAQKPVSLDSRQAVQAEIDRIRNDPTLSESEKDWQTCVVIAAWNAP